MYFDFVENLHQMEQSEQWEAVRKLLRERWLSQKDNLGALIRLASECWLILTDWECSINNEGLDYELFKRDLIATCSYGLEHFGDDEKILCLFGYMMSLFPYLFYLNDDPDGKEYLAYESKGHSLLEKAYRNYSNVLLVQVFFLGSISHPTKYQEAKYRETRAALKPFLSALFPGDTAIEEYFKDVLGLNSPY